MKLQVCCLAATPAEIEGDEAPLVFDAPGLETQLAGLAGVVLATGSEARAAALLDAGAARVYVGEAALLDSGAVERLVGRYGGERLGVYVPTRRMAVNWAFETVSNADFKVVAPSLCEPAWEILRADGTGTGTLAGWWIGEMAARGVQSVLLQADICDDDLNLCAGLVETYGERICFAPPDGSRPALGEWVSYGQVRNIALPPEHYRERDVLLPPEPLSEAA